VSIVVADPSEVKVISSRSRVVKALITSRADVQSKAKVALREAERHHREGQGWIGYEQAQVRELKW
jgi:hypothetical protein